MKKPNDIGKNVTGIALSPVASKSMVDFAQKGPAPVGDERILQEVREEFTNETGIIGTVPPPATLKGLAKTAMDALKGKRASVFVDKLGERLAFERTGSRLYEALIAKHDALGGFDGGPTRQRLVDFHDDELRHFEVIAETIEKLGGDPTVMTPSADIGGVESAGLLQVLTDPRTTLEQCLHAMLIAELADNDGWTLLSDLAEAMGHDDMAATFREALADEGIHLAHMRRWVNVCVEIAAQPALGGP